jgi:hypothetical protein
MSRKKGDKGRLPPFVPLLCETAKTPAFKMLSFGARWLFMGLTAQLKNDNSNNGRVFLSQRKAAEWLGRKDRTEIANFYRELEHYGFLVKTSAGCLGVEGKGKAPHYRVTDRKACNGRGEIEPPTGEFLRWDGTVFEPHKRPSRRWNADKAEALKNRIPDGTYQPPRTARTNHFAPEKCSTDVQSGRHVPSISAQGTGRHVPSISSLTTGLPSSDLIAPAEVIKARHQITPRRVRRG